MYGEVGTAEEVPMALTERSSTRTGETTVNINLNSLSWDSI